MQKSAVHAPNTAPTPWPVTLPPQTALQECIHERHADVRDKIILALNAGYLRWHQRAARRLSTCCNGASFFIDPQTAKVKPWMARCHHRMCPFCGRSRSGRVADQLLAILNKMKSPRIIVLTVKATTRPLSDQLRTLRLDFAKLRRRKFWRTMVTGGAYTLQATRNPKSGLWHPHLHLIVDGTYIPHKLLRNRWHDVTGSAEIIWIQAVHDRPGAAKELARYIGRPADLEDWPAEAIREYALAVNGARMVQAFGDCHGLPVEDRDEPDTEPPDTYRVRLSRLVHLTFRGADTPAKLLVLIAERWPQFRSYIYHQLPRLELPVTKADRFKHLLNISKVPGVTNLPAPTEAALHAQQDQEIFMAFCRYRADEKAEVFQDLDFTAGDFPQWT